MPCGPINDVQQALEDIQVQAHEAILEVEHPGMGVVRQIASRLRVDSRWREIRRGERTAEVLREVAGLSYDELTALSAAGALGD